MVEERALGCTACGNNRFVEDKIVTLTQEYVPTSEQLTYRCTNCDYVMKKGRI